MTIIITGQPKGGKNNICITKSGHRFPKKSWAIWRDAKVAEIRAQLPKGWKPIDEPTNISFFYRAEDKRRRDMPAIIDAVFHCLEKAGFCADDTHLWVTESRRHYSKENPGVTIIIPDP